MPKLFCPPYSFELNLILHCRLSPHLKEGLLPSARAALRALPKSLLRRKLKAGICYGVSISIVSSAEIKKLNAKYRRKNKPTDVLSFSRLEGFPMPSARPEAGDIILCASIAQAQARELEIDPGQELQMLVVHGILHLFGYDHETSRADARKMFTLQDKILSRFGIEPGRIPIE